MAAFDIVSLDTATPQLEVPQTGDTYNAPRAIAIAPEGLTGSAATPSLDVTQTWNTTGTPTALKLNVTDTASNAASLLMDLQVGGSSFFRVKKDGQAFLGTTVAESIGYVSFYTDVASARAATNTARNILINAGTAPRITLKAAGQIGWSASAAGVDVGDTPDVSLFRDAADTLAQRRGTNAQAFRVYRSFTDASNYSRVSLGWSSSTAILATEGAGTGARGNIAFGSAALATSATVGYLMIPTSNGAPTGVPADIPTGQVALHYDTANNKIYVYNGGWVSTAALT